MDTENDVRCLFSFVDQNVQNYVFLRLSRLLSVWFIGLWGILIKTSGVEPWELLLCGAAAVAEENPLDPARVVVCESNVMNWFIFHDGGCLGILTQKKKS